LAQDTALKAGGFGGVRRARKVVLALLVLVVLCLALFVGSAWSADSTFRRALEFSGGLLILICIAGRTWCSLYVGSRKTVYLATMGPYSLVRNPLYFFSAVGALGIGAAFGSVLVALFAALSVFAVFDRLVREEEAALETLHGASFRDYRDQVPRFLPRFSGWKNVDRLDVDLRAVRVTFLDSLFFLPAIPVAIIIENLRASGQLATILRIP
jgi:protein-S-isoprenylcysteine O-methyltransferase Ste14